MLKVLNRYQIKNKKVEELSIMNCTPNIGHLNKKVYNIRKGCNFYV